MSKNWTKSNLVESFKHSSAGTTLVELMVAVAILGIVAIGLVGSFATVSKSIQFSKTRALASNLAQEQMQILKQKDFHKVLVTTSTAYITTVSPSVPYDTGYYPPENIREGGIDFVRYTYVQVADENSGNLQYFGAVSDTGMKAITVTVAWTEGSTVKKTQLRNVLANINTTMANSIFTGQVTRSGTGTALTNATVSMAENVGFFDSTNASGVYTINLSAGNYTIYVTAEGYFPEYRTVSIAANASQTQNFALVAMGSGTVQGTAWINNHLVISQVVGSSETYSGSGYCQEYVEVFNPTTFTWTINGNVDLGYVRYGSGSPTFISMDYNTNTVPPSSYYLFSNTSPVVIGGVSRTADAVFQATNADYPDIIWVNGSDPCGSSSGDADLVGIAWASSGVPIDLVAWTGNGHTPGSFEGAPIVQGTGLQDAEQYVRKTSTSGVTNGLGKAYDSENNDLDFSVVSPITHLPRNSSVSETVVSGTPAYGAFVSATDGLSSVTNAISVGSPPVAQFQLISVATGTWTVFIASGASILDISSVTVTANSTTFLPNSVSTPSWPSTGYNAAILTETASGGYVSGWVKNVLGAAISPSITVSGPGATALASASNGMYMLTLSTGVCDINANPNNQNSSYVSASSQSITVSLGQVTSDINFTLSQGGRIRGFVTRDGTNPMPGIAVVAYNAGGTAADNEVSGSDGRYTLVNLATGTYTVEPILGSGEISTPSNSAVTVTAGGLVSASTFTISGSYGTIRGAVTSGGAAIRTGVLIICSTTTITSPPSLNTTTLTGAGYYVANSYEDGTYSMEVRGSTSTTYRLYAYYTTFTGSVPIVSTRSTSGVTVTQGVTTSGVNFTW